MDLNYQIDLCLEKTCWVVDILPRQVEKDSSGQYIAVEDCWHQPERLAELYRRFADLLLKLNCYQDFQVSFREGWVRNPPPEVLTAWVMECAEGEKDYMNILLEEGESMVIVNGDDLYLSLYGPSEELLALVRVLAGAAGLFLWKTRDETA